jgi:hypothetical protein
LGLKISGLLQEMNHRFVFALLFFVTLAASPARALAQRGQRGGRGQAQAPVSAKASAAIDLTGYWVSVVTEDWQFRMVTPPKGDYSSVPLNPEGRRVADAWDPAKDEASGNQCKAYGAGGIMRVPGRLHITWENDNVLRVDTDAGMQTRLFRFETQQPDISEPAWQGQSTARWEYATGQRATTPAQERQGSLKVVTTRMRPGYLRKNGVPYGANAVMNETFQLIDLPNGDHWLIVTSILEDPQYLTQPFITSTNFKKLANNSGWNPVPCSAK